MSYRGLTYKIPFSAGGLTHNENVDLIPPEAMVHPSKNINIHEGGRGKRGGTGVVGNAISGTPKVIGIYQFVLKNGSTFLITAANNGKVYADVTEITSGLNTSAIACMFETAEDELYISNGYNTPRYWTGVGSAGDISNPHTDWSGTNQPKHLLLHSVSLSKRMFAYGVANQPQRLYWSVALAGTGSKGQDFANAGSGTIDIETGDGYGIISVVEYGSRLFIFGKKDLFILDDSDATPSNWTYYKVPFKAGIGAMRLAVVTPYDLVAMAEDGEIYSIVTAQQYGDYKAGSLTTPAHMHEWIKEFVDLSTINQFHVVYNPVLRAIFYFVMRKNTTYIDTALVYFLDKGVKDGWITHDNKDYNSGYKCASSCLIRESAGVYKVYTGGWDDGYVWELDKTVLSDNGNPYSATVKTSRLNFENPRLTKRFDKGWLITAAKGDYSVYVDIWVDGVSLIQRTVSLVGVGSTYGGGDTYGADASAGTYGGDEMIDAVFDIGAVGKRIQIQVSNNNANEDFFLSQIAIDFKPLGVRPA